MALLPIAFAHAVFLILTSFAVTKALGLPEPKPGPRQAAGVVVLSVVIAAVVAAVAPSAPFLPPVLLTMALAWTPVVPILGVGRTTWSPSRFLTAIGVSLPFLAVTELIGLPLQMIDPDADCCGLFEGGAIILPVLGAHMFLASVTAALVSTVVYVDGQPRQAERFT